MSDTSVVKKPEASTEGGTTTIADSVVAKIAGIAAREVDGVADMGGAVSSTLSGLVGRIRGEEHQTAGVGVEVGNRQAAVDVTLKVHYPAPVAKVAEQVRARIIDRVETMTGLEVVEVNVLVTDLVFEGASASTESESRVQ